jgi:glycosyltransferase involved in cell wall biosynthesis
LAELAPQTHFVLLTHIVSHEELAELDRPNVKRRLVIGDSHDQKTRPKLWDFMGRAAKHLPTQRLQRLAGRVIYRIKTMVTRRHSATLLDDIGADLLFCPFTAPTYFHPRVPAVCTIYDLQYKEHPEFFSPDDVAHRNNTFVQATLKASRLAAISNFSRDAAIEFGKVDPTRIKTIYLRMAHRTLNHDNVAEKALLDLQLTKQRYLIYPANFWQHKNHEMLLTAFGMACAMGLPADLKLVCTGSPGSRQDWLTRVVANMNLADRVIFPGFLPTDAFSALMKNSLGVIFPSLYEGFGLPVIEAMAASKPVACSNNTSLKEVAGDAALSFNPRVPAEIAQAILSLSTDESLREDLVQKGLKRAIEFSDSSRMAKEYWKLFQEALSGNDGAPSHKISSNVLTGVHPDGWASAHLTLQVTETPPQTNIELVVFAPNWIPERKLQLLVDQKGSSDLQLFEIKRGQRQTCVFSTPAGGAQFEIEIRSPFIPAETGDGDDARELTGIVERCSIVQTNGKRTELTKTANR